MYISMSLEDNPCKRLRIEGVEKPPKTNQFGHESSFI